MAASEGGHPIRVAVNTGEAVVSMGTGPQVGEAVAGDVVNTASRMQSAAPPGGIVIGELTWIAVRDHFDTKEREPFTAKGKAEPIPLWDVVGEREVASTAPTTSLIGRERELVLLADVVARARDERCAQLVTIVAEPGIGKSRLVLELQQTLGDEVGWLQSACAPYGDTNAFASMTEVVRELAGVHLGDAPEVVDDALAALVARAESAESERAWLRTRLSVLADVTGGEGQVPVAEVASAAARVLEAAAADRPLVLTIEDLHWSEQALRDVLSAIVDDADAPLVVLCSARPELFDTDAAWGGGRANSTTIRLAPLSDEETATLVETLLTTAIKSETERARVLRNIGGNPLFAVEYVRMLSDTLQVVVEADMPVSVQAVIGARLDSVAPPIRAVLQDAAVIGARFWPDALATVGDGHDVRGALVELARRGLVVRSTTSWFPEQAEYGFSHALVREVAYARLPRMVRARKHASVGAWLETAVGERGEEFADALAHHFEQAVLLADASGERREADAWRSRAATWLSTAGEVALRLDPAGAFARNERVLAITTEEDPQYAQALAFSALAGRRSALLGRDEVLRRQQQVVAIYVANGDRVAEARGRASLGGQLMAMARREEARREFATAAELLAGEPEAASELALVRAWMAEDEMFSGNPGPAADYADQALATGAANEQVAIMALHIRGDSRIALGDPDGIEDLHEALDRAQSLGSVSEIITSYSYIADHRVAGRGAGARAAAAGRGQRPGRPSRRVQPGFVEQGRGSRAARGARPVGRGAHPGPAVDRRRAHGRVAGGGRGYLDHGGAPAAPAATGRRRGAPGPSARRGGDPGCGARAGRSRGGGVRGRGSGAGRGACGGVRNGDPRQGIDVSIGVGGVGDARSRWPRARPRSPTIWWAARSRSRCATSCSSRRPPRWCARPRARWSPRSGRTSSDDGTTTATSSRRRTPRSRSDARRATPSRRREALRCSPRSGCPGSAWDTSAPWIPKKRHSSRSLRHPACLPGVRAGTSRRWRRARPRTSSAWSCSWSAPSARTS